MSSFVLCSFSPLFCFLFLPATQVLYHLCNPDVPKFLSTCSNCYKEIHSGDRYHCETCTDFDLCKARVLLSQGLGGGMRLVLSSPLPF